jgi:hypothetical protein
VFLASALVPLTAEASLPRTSLAATNAAALAGAEAVDSGQLLAAGLETPFTLLAGDELEKALTCNPTPSVESLTSAEGARLEPPQLTSRACDADFTLHLEPVDFGLNQQRGPPFEIPDLHQGWLVADSKTRIGGFRLELEDFIGGERHLSLDLHRGYEVERLGFTEGEPTDPWGLSSWSALQGYVAGVTEVADPTGLLPEVEAVDAGYHAGSRDAEDFAVSKETGRWVLRALTFVKAGAQQIVRHGWKEGAKRVAVQELAARGKAQIVGGATEALVSEAGVDPETARLAAAVAGSVGTPLIRSARSSKPPVVHKVGKHTLGTYKDVKGHHPHQQAARSNNPAYDPHEAITVREGTFDHRTISKEQLKLNAEARKLGKSYDLSLEEEIQRKAMQKSELQKGNRDFSEEEIDEILKLSRDKNRAMNAEVPSRVPGSRKGP